jgi:hypothetical protein
VAVVVAAVEGYVAMAWAAVAGTEGASGMIICSA